MMLSTLKNGSASKFQKAKNLLSPKRFPNRSVIVYNNLIRVKSLKFPLGSEDGVFLCGNFELSSSCRPLDIRLLSISYSFNTISFFDLLLDLMCPLTQSFLLQIFGRGFPGLKQSQSARLKVPATLVEIKVWEVKTERRDLN